MIDPATLAHIATHGIPVGHGAGATCTIHYGRYAYVTCEGTRTVLVGLGGLV